LPKSIIADSQRLMFFVIGSSVLIFYRMSFKFTFWSFFLIFGLKIDLCFFIIPIKKEQVLFSFFCRTM